MIKNNWTDILEQENKIEINRSPSERSPQLTTFRNVIAKLKGPKAKGEKKGLPTDRKK